MLYNEDITKAMHKQHCYIPILILLQTLVETILQVLSICLLWKSLEVPHVLLICFSDSIFVFVFLKKTGNIIFGNRNKSRKSRHFVALSVQSERSCQSWRSKQFIERYVDIGQCNRWSDIVSLHWWFRFYSRLYHIDNDTA